MSFHHQWYLYLLHWMIQSLIRLSNPWLVNSHPALHITLLVITGAFISRTVTQIAMSCHHRWYLWLLHWMIQSLIYISCLRCVNSHPDLHITQLHSFKPLQYLVGIQLICQIPLHRRPPRMEVVIFIDPWWMLLSWHRHINNSMA